MKNPHGVEPTRFMKRKESEYVIYCSYYFGPSFGSDGRNILLLNRCNGDEFCWINANNEYECHPEYKSSLFVNTAGPDEENPFFVFDYEVYCIDNYKDYLSNICKHPDLILEYLETGDISEDSLKQIDDEAELLTDLDVTHYGNKNIQFKISHSCFKNPSKYLTNSLIVKNEYDNCLKEWLGKDTQWRLIFESSLQCNSKTNLFFEFYDIGPTLIVIKSSGGWIFGGYTTQLWKVVHPNSYESIYYDMILIINRCY